jgi:formate hydrogenlyase subunit 4
MMAMIVLEPLLAIAIIIGAIHSGSLRLEVILNGSVYQHGSIPAAGLLMLGVIIFSMQAFVGRVPFDTSEAETEIMEGPLMEYSGPKLALFKYTQMAKLFVYSSIFIAIFAPWGNTWIYPLNILLLLAKVFILVLVVTAIAATHARYRIDQVIRYYASLFGISLVALMLAIYGL